MAITLIGSSKFYGANNGTGTISLPAGVAAGHTAILTSSGNGSEHTYNLNRTGWTLVQGGPTAAAQHYVYAKHLAAADITAGSITVSTSAPSTQRVTMSMAVFSGVRQDSTFIHRSAKSNTANNATYYTPAITTTITSRIVQIAQDKSLGTTAWTIPAGTRRIVDQYPANSGTCSVVIVDSNADVAAGPYGNQAFTASTSSSNVQTTIIALEPVAAGTTAPPAKFMPMEAVYLDGRVAQQTGVTVAWEHLNDTGEDKFTIDTTNAWMPVLYRPWEWQLPIKIRMTTTLNGLSSTYEYEIPPSDYIRMSRMEEDGSVL